ncbi:MAG TPA: ABC transporter substrate-binding protein [Gammaproteobacteria bacterium]|nr:ABC transporter substrate-binding protein [Gammaproteobacteria bacterium]
MENRFSIKDFFFFLALFILLIVLLTTMYMIDRQWQKLAGMETALREQSLDIRKLRENYTRLQRRLDSGELAVNTAGAAPSSPSDSAFKSAFERSLEVSRRPDYAEGDWRVQAFASPLKTMTPLVSSDVYASTVQGFVLESLLVRDPQTLEWRGLLAKSWSVSDDGLTFTFQMRPEARFSDGQPLTAEDVAFTYAFIMNPVIKAPRERAYYEKIASVEATGPHEVVFHFKEPYFNSLSLAGGMSILAKHFYGRYLKDPEAFNQSKGLLFGSGPYRVVDPENWTPDKGSVELERDPRYWGPVQPSFDRLVWRFIENETARLTSYRNGEIDVYGAQPREYKRNLLKDKRLMAKSLNFEYLPPTAGYRYIGWNEQRQGKPTRFADKRVRQAMTWLTDKQRIVDEIMLGYGEPAVGPFSPKTKQHAPELKPRKPSLEKAKALLKAAGYEDRDGDGVLEDAQGKPFEFDLVYPQGNEQYTTLALFLKDSYARAGIKMNPRPTEWSVMLDLLDKKDFEAISLGWSGGLESDPYQIFHSDQAKNNGDNFVNYKNPKLDKLIEKARAEVDEEKRMPLWREVERILYEDQPYTFLTRGKSLVLVDKRMHNVEVLLTGLNISETPIGWYVPAKLQKYQ